MPSREDMIDAVIDTYKCLLSCRKKMPGMRLEEAFNPAAVTKLESEYLWLLKNEVPLKDPAK